MYLSLVVLTISALIWTMMSVHINQNNADELVNIRLFESWDTFRGATFPGAHSFLIKWPLFALLRLLGPSVGTIALLTIVVTLGTIGGLVFMLHQINRSPLIFGTLVLALASVLAFTPIQPYPGALLPVNMAMIATRNIEYLLYIFSFVLLIRASSFRSAKFWLGVACLGLLVASDKLFLFISLGGAGIALAVHLAARNWRMVRFSASWIGYGVLAYVFASGLLYLISEIRLTHIASQASPYGLVPGPKQLAMACLYSALAVLTNLGANLVSDITVLKDIPGELVSRMISFGMVANLVNGAVVAMAGFFIFRALGQTLPRTKPTKKKRDTPMMLSLMLIYSSVAAIVLFVASDHYYAVDSRYLTIVLFAVFVTMAAMLRRSASLIPRLVYSIGAVLLVGTVCGIVSTTHAYTKDAAALADMSHRSALISEALKNHPVKRLLGDYWRIFPALQNNLDVTPLPLGGCTTPQTDQTSTNWQGDLTGHSFAYLLTLDSASPNFPGCSLEQIILAYNNPNSSVIISGGAENPREVLLFYDHGLYKRKDPQTPPDSQNPVVPIALDQLPLSDCDSKPIIMNIVAHQDDDLLFMNPETLHDIQAKRCIRSVYLTAGDAGSGQFYWLAREKGSEAAYASMLGIHNLWIQRTVKLGENEFATAAYPVQNRQVILLFMHLPDGNLNGNGFSSTHHESLARLESNKISVIHGVAGISQYTKPGLIQGLAELMRAFQPTEIRSQAPRDVGRTFHDHSDHITTGQLVSRAYQDYANPAVPINYYVGYPTRERPQNVFGKDLDETSNIFLSYIQYAHDTGCESTQQCLHLPSYGSYLRGQYILNQNPMLDRASCPICY